MRINQFVAQATGLSRRSTDKAIIDGRVKINNVVAELGQTVEISDRILLDNTQVKLPLSKTTILINKPTGYVCSRDGQGSPTIYDLVPGDFKNLKHVGRLDKDSSGLVILTDDGELAHELSHPKFEKTKIYTIELDKTLEVQDKNAIENGEVKLDDKPSILKITAIDKSNLLFSIELHEGRNRQIRRTFAALGYDVVNLRRDSLGPFSLNQIKQGTYTQINP